jgi:hypothetical protein
MTPLLDVDRDIVTQQLGYLPPNYLKVSARTATGSPIAIQTYPLIRRKVSTISDDDGGKDERIEPFPTHYWLTNPEISRAIGQVRMTFKECIISQSTVLLVKLFEYSSLLVNIHHRR